MITCLDLPSRAVLTPRAPAIESAQATWSFAELAGRASRVAAHLESSPNAGPVGLLLEGSAEFAASFHGIALAGRTVLPLNLRLTTGELAAQLADARAERLLGAAGDARLDELAARLPSLRVETAPRTDALPAPRDLAAPAARDPRATLAVLYTSGTSRAREGRVPSLEQLRGQCARRRGAAGSRGVRTLARLHAAVSRRRAVDPGAQRAVRRRGTTAAALRRGSGQRRARRRRHRRGVAGADDAVAPARAARPTPRAARTSRAAAGRRGRGAGPRGAGAGRGLSRVSDLRA